MSRKRFLSLESLEVRANPAVAIDILASGAVQVNGDDANNEIILSITNSGLLRHNLALGGNLVSDIDIDSDQAGEQTVSIASLADKSITVEGRGGNDRLDVSSLVLPPKAPVNEYPTASIFVFGQEGNDVLIGSAGNDFLEGCGGDDVIHGNNGDDILIGDLDRLAGRSSTNTSVDELYGGAGNDRLYGEDRAGVNDIPFFGGTPNFIDGGDGDDILEGGAGGDNFYGGEGYDIFRVFVRFNAVLNNEVYIGNDGVASTGHGLERGIFFGSENANTIDARGFSYGDVIIDGGAGNDTIYGGEGNDFLAGQEGDDYLAGEGGNDEVFGDGIDETTPSGNDILFGGAGNDNLYGDNSLDPQQSVAGNGNDELYGDDGDDQLHGSGGSDFFIGGNGFDSIIALITGNAYLNDNSFTGNGGVVSANHGLEGVNIAGNAANNIIDCSAYTYGDVILWGGDGDDTLIGGIKNDFIDGAGGNDTLIGGPGNDQLYGSDGNDWMHGNQGVDHLDGADGDDTIFGGLDNDLLRGRLGNDVLVGLQGDDRLEGGVGDDWLYGDSNNAAAAPSNGFDTLFGQAGNDRLFGDNPFGANGTGGGTGNDTLYGQLGDDFLEGAGGDDYLNGGDNNDHLSGNAGNDFLSGENGNDLLDGAIGNDDLYGGAGNDTMRGGDQNDILVGEAGLDNLAGQAGNDLLIGGHDADQLVGGLGIDLLIAGATTYDGSSSRLNAIRDAWVIGLFTSFDKAFQNVTTGANALNDNTVLNDFVIDELWGNAGSGEVGLGSADLFFSTDQDSLRDFKTNDRRRRVV